MYVCVNQCNCLYVLELLRSLDENTFMNCVVTLITHPKICIYFWLFINANGNVVHISHRLSLSHVMYQI